MSITEKFLGAPGPIEISGRMLKRYDITTFEDGIEPGILRAACGILPQLVPAPMTRHHPPYLGCLDADPAHFGVFHRWWIGCIRELAPFGHERSSWVRHILEPDLPDLTGYINETLPEGRTGGAQ